MHNAFIRKENCGPASQNRRSIIAKDRLSARFATVAGPRQPIRRGGGHDRAPARHRRDLDIVIFNLRKMSEKPCHRTGGRLKKRRSDHLIAARLGSFGSSAIPAFGQASGSGATPAAMNAGPPGAPANFLQSRRARRGPGRPSP
jgi:hypothetical protein